MSAGQPLLEPPRIALDDLYVLDRPRAEDAAAHRRFALDPDAARFLGWTVEKARSMPDMYYDEVSRRFIRGWETGARLSLAIRRLSDEEAVGMVELRPRPPGAEADLSYLVAAELRGRGLATRALAAMIACSRRNCRHRRSIAAGSARTSSCRSRAKGSSRIPGWADASRSAAPSSASSTAPTAAS